jgi:hypothetical protein
MKPPTTGTEVFAPVVASTTGFRTAGFPVDFAMSKRRTLTSNWVDLSRLTYPNVLNSASSDAESDYGGDVPTYIKIDNNTGVDEQGFWGATSQVWQMFKRAPGFFDVVCFTTVSSSDMRINHNLGIAPELILLKSRSLASEWTVYYPTGALNKYLSLNSTAAPTTTSGYNFWGATAPSSTTFGLNVSETYGAGETGVAYLFATCAGVSKVGSYTGTGTTQTINCGFSGGARFVMIKRTDSTGGWYVWDSARGIVSGNDPYLLMNSTAAEVTNTDYIDPSSSGFEISSTAPAAINASGGTFIYLAIA